MTGIRKVPVIFFGISAHSRTAVQKTGEQSSPVQTVEKLGLPQARRLKMSLRKGRS